MLSQKNSKAALVTFTLVLVCTWIGIDAEFYEDSFYLFFATSLRQDLDLNIINQVPASLGRIVTGNYAHPSHHTIIQTPLILVLNFFDSLLPLGSGKGLIKPSTLGGLLLSFLTLAVGFLFSQKAAETLGVRLRARHFLVYLFSTAFFYFSFFMLSTIELYLFALSAYALYLVARIYRNDLCERELFPFGLALGLLLSSKITYVWLFLLAVSLVFQKSWQKKRNLLPFVLGASLPFIVAYLRDLASFGEVVMISRNLSQAMSLIHWRDLYLTFRHGVFGEGGMFYANPLFSLSLIGLFLLAFDSVIRKKESLLFWGALLLWLGASYFQTVFIIGPILEDHYVGRTMLTGLPLMLLGLAALAQKFTGRRSTIMACAVAATLILCQFYTLSNFLAISAIDHYAYATMKRLPDFMHVIAYLQKHLGWKSRVLSQEWPQVLLFCLVSTGVLTLLWRSRDKLETLMRFYLPLSTGALLIICALNLKNSRDNGLSYLSKKGLLEQVAVVDHASLYSFIYITDALKSQFLNTQDSEMREMILKKHSAYTESIRPLVKKGPPELRRALEDKDINFTFYSY